MWRSCILFLHRLDSFGFVPDVPPPSLSGLSRPKLKALRVALFGKVAALKQMAGEQCEEIAGPKGLKGRPTIKPGGMDQQPVGLGIFLCVILPVPSRLSSRASELGCIQGRKKTASH